MVSLLFGWMFALAATAGSAPATARPAAPPLATPQFRRYGIADGLPGAAVNAVMQDREGMMWFGGSGGVSRYDGVGFTTWVHEPDDPASLGSQDVTQLVDAGDGTVWIGTGDAGVDRLDPATGRVRHWRHEAGRADSLSDDIVYSLALAPDRSLWIGTAAGLDHLSADGRTLAHVPYLAAFGGKPDTRDTVVGALRAEADGTLWIGTWSGVLLKRTPDGHVVRVPVRNPSDKPNQIWRIEGSGADLRIGTKFGLYRIIDGVAQPAYTAAQMAPNYVFASTRDRAGRLWMATLHGVVLDDPRSGLHAFHRQPLLVGGLPGEWTWRVLADREGGVWLTFYDGGVAYLPPNWQNFARFTHVPDDPDSLSDSLASGVAPAADGTLWIGEPGRIDRLDPVTGKVEHVLSDLKTDPVAMVEQDGALWFTLRGVLKRYADGHSTFVDPQRHWLKRPEILVSGGPGVLYATVSGAAIVRIDTRTQAITPVPMPPDADQPDLRPAALGLADGALWYANHEGVMRWDAALGRMAFVPGVPRGEDVQGLSFDAAGFWVIRQDRLEHYRWDDHHATRDRVVDASNGWRAPVVRDVYEDARGALWIFTETGLWRLEPGATRLHRLGAEDGLMNSEFLGGVAQPVAGGPVYAPTHGGVVGFDPEQLDSRSVPTQAPPLSLAAISVRGRNTRTLSGEGLRQLDLGWRDRDLRVQARVASFVNPAGNRYRFRLVGLDHDWVDVGAHGEREFAGLRPGDYTLQVMAAGPDGPWGQLAVPLAIHVQAPPWDRWWAWVGYALVAVATAAALALAWRRREAQRHRMQMAEQQRLLAEQANAAKTQFLATLSHEIRTPMTGVIGMAELLLATPLQPGQREYAQAMQRSGAMLLKLLNDALDLARIEAGRFELEPAPFAPRQLLDDVARLVDGQARAKGIDFRLEIAADLPMSLMGDMLRIEQILLNLATNAVKFTEHGSITLCGQRIPDGVMFSVSDTGPGIPEASQSRLFGRFEQAEGPQRRAGSGLGLAICRELVTLMGGSIELESRLGQGSTFRVRLPLAELVPAAAALTATALPSPAWQVLLVEDDITVAAVIRGLLERQGHAVAHVANGLSALAELERGRPDLLLLDLDLPGLDGFQLARLIRQREGGAEHLAIVAITARSGGDEELRARQAGMDGFLRKPLSGAQLARAMEAAMASAAVPA
ncbi:histidine kinase [Dyella thiooxydans]|uniref:histidine kinase n=1 Tax=Dyella thiooxydans TaxID=445710 RepID=A0A160N578_9GAMM|nr:hybrid sensor histidine kinase/response regulator [Dyella thiooxydans]AND71150.1 histidine kinase [Dyella thiooxydans]